MIYYGDEAYSEGNYDEAMEFYSTMNKHDMVTICKIMLDQKVENREDIESLIENGMLDLHKEVLKHLPYQPIVSEMILSIYKRLFGGEE